MVELVKPDKNKHQYVVGIDFGHGETSAAICLIEWGKEGGQSEGQVKDIDMDSRARKKVIPSAICYVKGGTLIGGEAFEHMTDNNGIRLSFKQKPESIDGKPERLMIDYMSAVYKRIRESEEGTLTDDNHIVYIARPSGWCEEEAKELYKQMAIQAGIPLGGLTAESRAAIVYAKSPRVNFTKDISKGAIVFDLGSSTLDFTYLSDTEGPIDFGYNLGASIIDKAILEKMILKNDNVRDFVHKYPEYLDALQFEARKFKEDAYSRAEDSRTNGSFPLSKIINEDEDSFEEYSDVYVPLKVKNLKELNDLVNDSTQYMENLAKAMEDFRTTKISGKMVNGVFLTGGASRMNFIRPLIAKTFDLPLEKVRIDSDNPSLTISRGIAELGSKDAATDEIIDNLRQWKSKKMQSVDIASKLANQLAEKIASGAWEVVDSSSIHWIDSGNSTDEDELKRFIQNDLKVFQNTKVSVIINETLKGMVSRYEEEIRTDMNVIIQRYAPGRELSAIGDIHLGNLQAVNDSLQNMSATISEICDSITSVVADILWAALGIFLWGIFCAPWYIYKWLRSDESKRRDKVEKLREKKGEVIDKVRSKIQYELKNNQQFKNAVSSSFAQYFDKLIDTNIEKVRIPIE